MSENFLVFMMMIAALHLFDGLWEGFAGKGWEKVGKFVFYAIIAFLVKVGFKLVLFMINF